MPFILLIVNVVIAEKKVPVAIVVAAEPQIESGCTEEKNVYIYQMPPSALYSSRSIIGLVVHGSQIKILSCVFSRLKDEILL